MKKNICFLLLFTMRAAFANIMCDMSASDYYAIYEINSYTCNVGQYLPANTLGCVSCPNGFTCSGGTFDFNADYFQGLDFDINNISTTTLNNICANNFTSDLFAVYKINTHTCVAGYYLPANIDSCTICPLNNKCVGGTYAFNETTTQGIESCNGSFAPVGSAVCYPHVLHIGNESIYLSATKRTTPSLNVAYGNEVFYANTTTTPTVMTAGSSHYLKTIYNNTEYYICDNTSCPN